LSSRCAGKTRTTEIGHPAFNLLWGDDDNDYEIGFRAHRTDHGGVGRDCWLEQYVVFETATWTPISEISVGDRYPADAIAVDADGRYVYVAAWVHVTGGSWYQATLVIDTATDSIVDTLPLAHITALVVVDVP
jgi:hypothetical protein